ncbi:Spy/CpxP family protein refolding chaperone [Falsiroseomonas sp. E2-1-a4]|uniref:Spy/CpxP family protein refolding chaperone n=1 Tax=Falsiroseomonas sp. E2-1-a4 TaxID=3239299 RepID=UPI003F3EF44A
MVARIRSVLVPGALGMALALGTAYAQAPAQDDQDHSAHHPPGSEVQAQATPPAPAPVVPPQPGRPATPGMGMAPGQAGQPGMGMMPGQGGQPGMMGGDMGQMMQMMQRMMAMRQGGMSPAAMRAFDRIEGQLAYFRTELRVTDAQMPQWNAFADAVRTQSQTLRQAYMQAMQSAGQPTPAPAQLERRATLLRAQLDATQAIAPATSALYGTLSDEQKRLADELMAEHLRDMRRRGL